ncbi:MAG: hypothetical protein OEZ02_13310, partial [Anaerolineae bacterium]|nr:hypothetical protein [Anaerolineae bacterium]
MHGFWRRGIYLAALLLASACQSEQTSLPLIHTATSTLPAATLAPTFTPFPSPSASPIPDIAPQVRLREEFDQQTSCLAQLDNEEARSWLAEDAYLIEISGTNLIASSNCETLVAGDFILEADITVRQAPEQGGYYFGLNFRVSGLEHYSFVVNSEGGYCAYFGSDQFYIPLTNSTDFNAQCWVQLPASALREGSQHMLVKAVAGRFDLYLNGV